MKVKKLLGVLVVAMAGWSVGDWFAGSDRGSESATAEGVIEVESMLGVRSSEHGLVLQGDLSLQVMRVAKWASAVSLQNSGVIDARLQNVPVGILRDMARFIVCQRLLSSDPVTAYRFAADDDMRIRILSSLSLEALVAMLDAEPLIGAEVVSLLVDVEPEKALALAIAGGVSSNEVSEKLVSGLVEVIGFQGVADQLEDMDSLILLGLMTSDLVTQWGEKEPAASLSWIESLPDSDRRFWGVVGWTDAAGQSHPEETLAMADRLRSPMMKSRAIRRSLVALAKTDSDLAFDRLRESELSDTLVLGTARTVVRNAAETDPVKALERLEWLAQERGFAEAALYKSRRDRVYHSVMSDWAERDLEAAQAFAEGLADPTVRAIALEGIAKREE